MTIALVIIEMMQFGDEVILFDNTDDDRNDFDGNGNYVNDTRLTTEEEEVTPTGGRSSNAMSTSSTALRERGD